MYWYHVWYHAWYYSSASMISRTYDIIGIWYHRQYCVIFILISCMTRISCMISWSCIYDIKNLWYHRSMISKKYNMISIMISGVISSMILFIISECVYPPPKTRSEECSASASPPPQVPRPCRRGRADVRVQSGGSGAQLRDKNLLGGGGGGGKRERGRLS